MANREELILGCDCMDIQHITRLNYFPQEDGVVDDDDNVIYMTMPAYNFYTSISPFYCWGIDIPYFIRFNFLRRFYYAFLHIFNTQKLSLEWREGVMDGFDFRDSDLGKLYDYLNFLAGGVEGSEQGAFCKESDGKYFQVCFYVDRLIPDEEDFPFVLGFSVMFKNGNLWDRVKTACSYIFGTHSNEIGLSLNKKDVKALRSFITLVKKTNSIEKEINNDKNI
jgi:hypothetical protein